MSISSRGICGLILEQKSKETKLDQTNKAQMKVMQFVEMKNNMSNWRLKFNFIK